MPPRLPTPSALRAPFRPFAFLRPFSSTSAANDTPSSNPPPRASTTHSLAGLNNSNSGSTARGAARQQKQAPPKWQQRGDISSKLLERYRGRADDTTRNRQARLEVLRNQQISRDYLRQMPRNWDIGDVYSPNDLSPIEMAKWRKRSPRTADVVNALGIRPLDMYKNFCLIQDFTSPTGAIQPRSTTRLSLVNQRKVAKMIRRAQGMGIYPTIHDHPELIRDDFYPQRK
ncbi:hypothetical protein S7711_00048 [Stachybotrys chartarum IBT 7711]|uniref:Small ribosomal subunit protein bS18m n=1 Tax=Stachybotrys chartarum (strain CBS 109288 / IBT 7711) TaxID=1280523 RepID=A0A084B3A0_STACB|nr:hypothetical protein S7711_00048 [Stachybotrys chartarum IBT 7711]KFA74612.1 hypothetical protein S40288_05820 [Stachybotrys chartarum IBT 40288]